MEVSSYCSEGFDMGGYSVTIECKFLFVKLNLIYLKHLIRGKKKEILQTVGERWRHFKSDLMSKWALAADKESDDDIVCKKYDISKEKWAQFCQTCRDPSWKDVQKKTQAIQKQNTAPHVLSRGGYEYLENKLMNEKRKKKLEEDAQSGSTGTMIDPPSPIRQHVKWKMTRTKKPGQMTSEAAKEIPDKIIRFLCPPWTLGCPDCCHWVTRTPWSCACYWSWCDDQEILWTGSKDLPHVFLHGSQRLGGPVGGVNHTKSDSTTNVVLQPDAVLVSITDAITGTSTTFLSLRLVLQLLVSAQRRVVERSRQGDSDKCELYIEENPPCLVALGRVYEGSTTVHNIPLLHDQVKRAVGLAKPADRPDHEVDDPIYVMTLTIPQLFLKPLQVMWDATMFRVFNEDFPLYIKHGDLSDIAHGGQCLSIFVIQLHMTETSMRMGNSDVYGFLKPQSI
ncbi:hypothetical protein GmHk_15G044066 [Glycine max]|nr:hypothetical protein GmHk_15G044066 [Glycine max]